MHPGKDLRVAVAVGLVTAISAALGLVLVLSNVELGINRWLALEAAVPPGAFRVASVALATFVLVGSSLALSRFERHRLTATLFAGLAGAIAVFALLGYVTGIDTLYGSVSLNSPHCRLRLACSVSLPGSSCGSERCRCRASPDRCGASWSCSEARSWRRSCCLVHMRDFVSPTRSSAMFGKTSRLKPILCRRALTARS
jgi:hypothetical protein